MPLFQPSFCLVWRFHESFTLAPTRFSRRREIVSARVPQEDTVLRPSPIEWPTWHDDPSQSEQPRGGPLRHDITLARYLEKQRACRASTVRGFDLRTTAINLWQAGSVYRARLFQLWRPFHRSV
ncbi:hypothetical protein MES5069_180018 [Mesorhizobium escarrei]|uniref:Uncharacterized protein n=1 Tax=Mesorhizobium escarrei TaxID=666018 RepID=A0ABN8JLS6_9HYPH|nr:hypothetical protein MES5069_180018 [Mesorhizobium escarrei]